VILPAAHVAKKILDSYVVLVGQNVTIWIIFAIVLTSRKVSRALSIGATGLQSEEDQRKKSRAPYLSGSRAHSGQKPYRFGKEPDPALRIGNIWTLPCAGAPARI
jgi:hypothetical protein